ncbi:MAG TPA: fatty acid desaturase [Casimicrobiaceae bacterium]|jgi:stearoyl-CoA desaturase (Delta-9 desaturase)|nr:fatty acid desaturase [Casimicrobiaceae bacterium]
MSYDLVPQAVLSFAAHGLIDLPWWGYVIVALGLTHVTIAAVTIFLHRGQAHRGLDLHPAVSHFFRFWLWLTTGMVTKEWVAIHRKHHAKVETDEDPHSPQTRGIRKVLLEGAELYRTEAKCAETLEKYGHGTPDDWMERNVYAHLLWQGVGLMMVIDLVLFGAVGLSIWAVQMLWIPVNAAGIINGIGHYWGYRNFACNDSSTNIVPWGFLIGGEELHNNHHAYGSSAKFSSRWYELDLGWGYIRLLSMLKLATVRKVAPKIKVDRSKAAVDLATLQAVITHRYAVATAYAGSLKAACASEIAALRQRHRGRSDVPTLRRLKRWLSADPSALTDSDRAGLAHTLQHSTVLQQIYAMRQELALLWGRSTESSEQLLARLQDWCHRAEASGIAQLAQFSLQLKRISVA